MKQRLLSLASMLALFFSPYAFAERQSVGKAAALVTLFKTEAISLESLEKALALIAKQKGSHLTATEKQQVLDAMVDRTLFLQAAEREKVTVSNDALIKKQLVLLSQQVGRPVSVEEFKQVVSNETSLTFEDYLKRIHDQTLVETYVFKAKKKEFDAIKAPTEQEVKTLYERESTSFVNPPLVRFSHIFFDTRQKTTKEKKSIKKKVQTILKTILNGQETFEKMVRVESEDPASQAKGGDVGFLTRGNAATTQLFGEDFVEKIFALKVNSVTLLESLVGYHIVRKTEALPKKFLELNDSVSPTEKTTVREEIKRTLTNQKRQQLFVKVREEMLKEFRKDAEIRVLKDHLPWS